MKNKIFISGLLLLLLAKIISAQDSIPSFVKDSLDIYTNRALKEWKWIPEFALNNKAGAEQAIIRDLLCHRIGFQTFQGDFTYWTSKQRTADEVFSSPQYVCEIRSAGR